MLSHCPALAPIVWFVAAGHPVILSFSFLHQAHQLVFLLSIPRRKVEMLMLCDTLFHQDGVRLSAGASDTQNKRLRFMCGVRINMESRSS